MKSKFFLLGFCALALAACSIDETASVNDTNAISFKATTATRATAATTNNIEAFTVWAWDNVGGATSEFMRGVEADKSGSVFITTPTYYWPGGTLDFYAFIPAATVETDGSTDYNAHFGEEVDLTGDIIETANGAAYDDYKGYVANAAVTDPATGEQIWPNYHELDDQSARLDYADITVPFDVDWVEGCLYTYTIVFGEGLGYYAPDDENTDLDGTPVLIPIRFTVEIGDFGNLDDVNVSTDTGDGGDDEGGYDPAALVLEYTLTHSYTLQLPIYDVTKAEIDWGDGSDVETFTSDLVYHTYSSAGTYYVSISGTVECLISQNRLGYEYLTAVIQWGDLGLTSMEYAFLDSENLTSLPEGPGPFENVTTFYDAFEYCFSLKEVPVGLFSNCTAGTNFYRTFYECSSVVGESPYDEINVNGNKVKVHLYERENYPEYFTAPTEYEDCFKGATFSDMDSIPSSWGGNGN